MWVIFTPTPSYTILSSSNLALIPPFHWPMLLWRSWHLGRFSKKAWCAVEAPRNVRFGVSRQWATLFACLYYVRSRRFLCVNTTPTVHFYCVCITLSIRSSLISRSTCAQSTTKAYLLRSLYDWGVLPTLVIRSWRSAL